jgi:hypothetical protein
MAVFLKTVFLMLLLYGRAERKRTGIFSKGVHKIIEMLKTLQRRYYQVKEGQTLEEIADYFSVSPRVLAHENSLKSPPTAGKILWIPKERGNAYTVKEGDTPALLCGSEEAFARKNGAGIFYLGMRAIL